MNKDNLQSRIVRAKVEDLTSKAGKDYTVLSITFSMPDNDTYDFTTFLNSEQRALINLSVPLSDDSFTNGQ